MDSKIVSKKSSSENCTINQVVRWLQSHQIEAIESKLDAVEDGDRLDLVLALKNEARELFIDELVEKLEKNGLGVFKNT